MPPLATSESILYLPIMSGSSAILPPGPPLEGDVPYLSHVPLGIEVPVRHGPGYPVTRGVVNLHEEPPRPEPVDARYHAVPAEVPRPGPARQEGGEQPGHAPLRRGVIVGP